MYHKQGNKKTCKNVQLFCFAAFLTLVGKAKLCLQNLLIRSTVTNKIMIHFQRMNAKVTTCVLIICLNQASALAIPKWSDIFSSLQPYKDPETLMLEEEDV